MLTSMTSSGYRIIKNILAANQLLARAKSRRKTEPPATISIANVRCEQKLGGLLKYCRWEA